MSILPETPQRRARIRHRLSELLPGSCLLCGADSKAAALCPACHDDLPRLTVTRCPRCAATTTHGEHCGSCLVTPPHFHGTTALYRYAFPVDRLIHALKYQHRLPLARWFGQQLGRALAGFDFSCIIPMPLHPGRLHERGFNQAMEIANALQKACKWPVDRDSLQRSRPTATQAGLPLKSRAANVRGAFECQRDFSGQRILLIDDVMTSGATASEAARQLRLHGAENVRVAVIARALRHH